MIDTNINIITVIISLIALCNWIISLKQVIKTHKESIKMSELLKQATAANEDASEHLRMAAEVHHHEVERFRRKIEEKDERI